MEQTIKVRYFENWGNEGKALFFSADSLSVIKLESIFRQLSSEEVCAIEISSLDFIQPYFGISIIARVGIQDFGIEKTKDTFEWIVTRAEWEKSADFLSAFGHGSRGHQYLETGSEYYYPMQIIVSVDEYPSDWIGWREK